MPDDVESGNRWTAYQIFIAILMVVTGSVNTLAAKWADTMEAKGQKFDHPFLQAVFMFLGEFLCLLVFIAINLWYFFKSKLRSRAAGDPEGHVADSDDGRSWPTGFNPLVMLPAAMCDMCATSVMYIGLNLTYASSFQMLRGSVIIFTGLLSTFILRSVLKAYRWVGMGLVMAGLLVVGLTDMLFGDTKSVDAQNVIIGDLLIVVAQVVVASQMVYEQKFVMKYDVPPLLAVGLEGLFGMTILAFLCLPMYYIKGLPETFSHNPEGRLEDVIFAFQQIGEQPLIAVGLAGTALSISFFNFAGISVTKELSATTRMILDSIRTLVIWLFSLCVGWQSFFGLQLLGFALLIIGMFVYNDLLIAPLLRKTFPRLFARGGIERTVLVNEEETESTGENQDSGVHTA